MTKTIPAVLVLALAYLFALSTALPSVLTQSVSAQTKPNVPRTLLGKPYRTRWDSQGCPPSRWTLTVADRNDADIHVDPNPGLDCASAYEAQIGNGGWTQTRMNTKPRVPIPLPLVLNTFPESRPARLRLMRSKRPMEHSPCSDDVPSSEKARSDEMNPRDQIEQRVQSPDVSKPESKQGPREVSVPVRRSKRLDDRGWKSRLFEEY